jgi:hypothetical protein
MKLEFELLIAFTAPVFYIKPECPEPMACKNALQ